MPAARARHDRDLLRTFSAISAALNLRQPLATTLDLIAEQVARTLGHRFCAIALYDEHSGSFSISGSYGLSAEYLDAANTQLRDQIERHGIARAPSVTVRAFRNRMPVQVDDIATDPTFGEWRTLAELVGYSSAVFLPLVFRDEPIGALSCYDIARTYTAEDVDALQPVAEQTATAVGIARLLERQRGAIAALERTTRDVNERNAMLRETSDATRTLTQLLLQHCSLEELVAELRRRLRSPIALCDENMRTLARCAGDGQSVAPSRGPSDIVVPVDGGDHTYGYLVIEGSRGRQAQVAEPLLEQAAMACALYFMREQAASERQLRLSSQLLHDLLNQDSPATEISRIARRLRLDEGIEYRILTVEPATTVSGDGALARRRVHAVAAVLRQLAQYRGGSRPVAHAPLGQGVVAVVPDAGAPGLLARAVHEALEDAAIDGKHRVAVSRACRQARDFRSRYQELRKCQELASRARNDDSTVIAERWHVHTMLMRNADDDDVRDRAHELLDPVLADNNGERLLTSVRTYLDRHTSVTRAAAELSVHPNTLKYRLRRLERLTGLTVGRVQDLIELQLALAVHDLDPTRFRSESQATATPARDRSSNTGADL